jgi:hypothetical protein
MLVWASILKRMWDRCAATIHLLHRYFRLNYDRVKGKGVEKGKPNYLDWSSHHGKRIANHCSRCHVTGWDCLPTEVVTDHTMPQGGANQGEAYEPSWSHANQCPPHDGRCKVLSKPARLLQVGDGWLHLLFYRLVDRVRVLRVTPRAYVAIPAKEVRYVAKIFNYILTSLIRCEVSDFECSHSSEKIFRDMVSCSMVRWYRLFGNGWCCCCHLWCWTGRHLISWLSCKEQTTITKPNSSV